MSSPETSELLIAALGYAKRGWAVLPLELHEVIGVVLARTGILLPYEAV